MAEKFEIKSGIRIIPSFALSYEAGHDEIGAAFGRDSDELMNKLWAIIEESESETSVECCIEALDKGILSEKDLFPLMVIGINAIILERDKQRKMARFFGGLADIADEE